MKLNNCILLLLFLFSCSNSKNKDINIDNQDLFNISDLNIIVNDPTYYLGPKMHPYLSFLVTIPMKYRSSDIQNITDSSLNAELFYFVDRKEDTFFSQKFKYHRTYSDISSFSARLNFQFDTSDIFCVFYNAYYLFDSCDFYYKDSKIDLPKRMHIGLELFPRDILPK